MWQVILRDSRSMLRAIKQSVSNTQRPDGSVATEGSEIATVLNNFFSSV